MNTTKVISFRDIYNP